jgi:hypothetical protein
MLQIHLIYSAIVVAAMTHGGDAEPPHPRPVGRSAAGGGDEWLPGSTGRRCMELHTSTATLTACTRKIAADV